MVGKLILGSGLFIGNLNSVREINPHIYGKFIKENNVNVLMVG